MLWAQNLATLTLGVWTSVSPGLLRGHMDLRSLKLSNVDLGIVRGRVNPQGRLGTANPSPFVGVNLKLWPILSNLIVQTDVKAIQHKNKDGS